MDIGTTRRGTLPKILLADVFWDALCGLVLVLAPWPAVAGAVGLAAPGLRPLFVLLGIGCFGFAVVLARAARGVSTSEICRVAAIANTVAVVAVIVLLLVLDNLGAGWLSLLALGGVGCAVFAVLEWAGLKRR